MKKYEVDWICDGKTRTETVSKEEYWDIMKLRYRERCGIYQTYSETLKTMTWYSYFGSEGFYKVHKNIETGKETRKHMKWIKCPKHLRTSDGWDLYMYFEG